MEPLLFETILIKNGDILNIKYHEKRVMRSREALFSLYDNLNLKSHIYPLPKNGKYRCKLIYSDKVLNMELKPYIYIEKKSFRIIDIDFDYSYKYLDRSEIDRQKNRYPDFDDLIFLKNGLITDTTIANIAIFRDGKWITPKTPLLEGTTRDRLLKKGKLTESDIRYEDIFSAEKFAVMNALSGFKIIDTPKFTLYDD